MAQCRRQASGLGALGRPSFSPGSQGLPAGFFIKGAIPLFRRPHWIWIQVRGGPQGSVRDLKVPWGGPPVVGRASTLGWAGTVYPGPRALRSAPGCLGLLLQVIPEDSGRLVGSHAGSAQPSPGLGLPLSHIPLCLRRGISSSHSFPKGTTRRCCGCSVVFLSTKDKDAALPK